MTSDTVPPCSSLPRRGPPIDLVLHALQDALTGAAGLALNEHTTEECERLATLACALTRTISPGALASSWAADGDADIAGAHLARRLADPGPDDGDLRPVSTAEGRALETAVARRLADTACSLAITGDKEDAAQASALWEASATLTGLHGLSYELRHDPTLKQELDAAIAATEKAIKERDEARVGWVEARWGRYWGGNIKGDNDAVPVKPRILQSADEAPCGSLMQTTEGQFEGRLVMRYLDGIGCGVPKANYWEDDSWEWEPFNTEHDFPARLIAEGLTEAECRHLSGLSAADAIAWCEARDKAAKRPQPGDVVSWDNLENGCLYEDIENHFVGMFGGRQSWLFKDGDSVDGLIAGASSRRICNWDEDKATLVARDLGSDPEAWRKAMREWTANGNRPAAPDADEPSAEAATLELLRAALAVPGTEDIVVHARKLKAELTGERETNARRMALLLQADERLDAVRAVIGANDGESTVDAAKRVADNIARLKARDACETCREDRRTAIKERDEARDNHVAARIELEKIEKIVGCDPHTRIVTACVREVVAERDAAIEARAQMQARLVAAERERDAAQEEAKALRVVVANKMSESMLAIMEGIAKGPTMEWRNGKP